VVFYLPIATHGHPPSIYIKKVRVVCLPYVLLSLNLHRLSHIHVFRASSVSRPACVASRPPLPCPREQPSSLCPLPFAVLLRTLATAPSLRLHLRRRAHPPPRSGPPQKTLESSVTTPRRTRHHRLPIGPRNPSGACSP
jgi:hypothetical protein